MPCLFDHHELLRLSCGRIRLQSFTQPTPFRVLRAMDEQEGERPERVCCEIGMEQRPGDRDDGAYGCRRSEGTASAVSAPSE
jgi:hypothetical protein